MRKLLIIVLMIATLYAKGQIKLDGKYCENDFYSSFCITFHNDSLFEYNEYAGLDIYEGKGVFKIEQNMLILNFDTINGPTIAIDSIYEKSDSVTLSILVLSNETKDYISYANILLRKLNGELFHKQTKVDGKSPIIRLIKENKEIEVTVSGFCFNSFKFSIIPSNSMNIVVCLDPFNNIPVGTKKEYRIKKVEGNKLVLRKDLFNTHTYIMKKKSTTP